MKHSSWSPSVHVGSHFSGLNVPIYVAGESPVQVNGPERCWPPSALTCLLGVFVWFWKYLCSFWVKGLDVLSELVSLRVFLAVPGCVTFDPEVQLNS